MGRLTIFNEASDEFEEKKSVFIGQIKHAQNEEEARKYIDSIIKKQKKARHNVYAYILKEGNIERYSDDGEPSGTSGISVLNVLEKYGLSDVVLVVTRYFGGILLGASGLSQAYRRAAYMAVKKSEIMEEVNGHKIKLRISYEILSKMEYELNKNHIKIENISYSDKVEMNLVCMEYELENVKKIICEISSGKFEMDISDVMSFYMKHDNG